MNSLVLKAERLQDLMAEMEKRQKAILADGRLSLPARDADLRDLHERTRLQITAVVRDTWKEGGAVQRSLIDAEAKLAAARDKAASGVDYSRLLYASEQVPSLIARAQSPDELLKSYEAADSYLQRALSETGASRIVAKWGVLAAPVASRFKVDAEARKDTAEVQAARGELAAVKSQAVALYQTSQRAVASVGNPAFSEGAAALQAVKIDERWTEQGYDFSLTWGDNGGYVFNQAIENSHGQPGASGDNASQTQGTGL